MLPTKFQFIWESGFRGEDFKNRPIRHKRLPVAVMFVNGSSIDASYQDSVHLAERFQRRRLKCEKLTDDGR